MPAPVEAHNLLVVDDDPVARENLAALLRRDGRHVAAAPSGYAALDQLSLAPFEVVVAGLGRNGMDGLELLRRTRALRPQTKVILTAELRDPARVVSAIQEHAYSYFHKPLASPALVDMVQQALSSSEWRDDIQVVSARPEWITTLVRCKMEAGERMVQFLRGVAAGMPDADRDDVASAFRELLLNAIEHGGQANPEKVVRVSLIRTARSFIAQIQDPGPGFSLDSLPHAAISNPDGSPTRHVELRAEAGQRPGGFGILMTRSLVDELIYNERGNEVMFFKHLA
jgi:two-component system, OmpR family, response regulator